MNATESLPATTPATKHTPGPWFQRAESVGRQVTHYVKIGTGNCYLTRGVGQTEIEVQANAALIAQAPCFSDLLNALRRLTEAATKFTVDCNCQTAGQDDALYIELERARAAIAMATA